MSEPGAASGAKTRRRWVTLAELVAIAGVVIAGLTLWNNWQDRRLREADRAAAVTSSVVAHDRVALRGTVVGDGTKLTLSDPAHDLTEVSVAFPKDLSIATLSPADATIATDAFADALLAKTGEAPSGRLPVLVTTRFLDGDASRTASGLYDIVWRSKARFLRGRVLRITGFRPRLRSATPALLDAAWSREAPATR